MVGVVALDGTEGGVEVEAGLRSGSIDRADVAADTFFESNGFCAADTTVGFARVEGSGDTVAVAVGDELVGVTLSTKLFWVGRIGIVFDSVEVNLFGEV